MSRISCTPRVKLGVLFCMFFLLFTVLLRQSKVLGISHKPLSLQQKEDDKGPIIDAEFLRRVIDTREKLNSPSMHQENSDQADMENADDDVYDISEQEKPEVSTFTKPRVLKQLVDPSLPKHDKWIIVTTIALPTDDVKFLAELPGWKVVVVGDTKTPSNWSWPNCEYLDVKTQESLGLSLPAKMPYKSYARKNVGYLYAIARGAKFIYETDDDNRPTDMLNSFNLEPTVSGLMYAGPQLFNPYKHFGQTTLWPRGYPLGDIGIVRDSFYRFKSDWPVPLIQQGVVNGDPDMDAVFRLTRKLTYSQLDAKFDPAAPPAILPPSVFSPFNSQNTLFHYQALWALYLPTTTTFRMCDIWRGYWAQRLLWEIGGNLAFYPPNAYQLRNAHSYMTDAKGEDEMYFTTDLLLNFLTDWKCPYDLSFFSCVHKLSVDMAAQKFWGPDDGDNVKLWLEDLINIGYPQPERVKSLKNPDTHLKTVWQTAVRQGGFVRFVAAEQKPPSIHEVYEGKGFEYANYQVARVHDFCKDVNNFEVLVRRENTGQHTSFDNVLLIIHFNRFGEFEQSIDHLEIMHRHFFPNILYCGQDPDGDSIKKLLLKRDLQISFIDAKIKELEGHTNYNCFIRASQMGYNVSDYLLVAGDTLVNTWNLDKINRSKIWSPPITEFSCQKGVQSNMWARESPVLIGAFKKFQLDFQHSNINNKLSIQNVLTNLRGNDTCVYGKADNYYIPRQQVDNVRFMLEYFSEHEISQEFVIPFVLHGAVDRNDIFTFKVKDLVKNDTNRLWDFYSPKSDHYLHPVKLSNKENHPPFCQFHLANSVSYRSGRILGSGMNADKV